MKMEDEIDKLLIETGNTDKHDFNKLSDIVIKFKSIGVNDRKKKNKILLNNKRFDEDCVNKLKYVTWNTPKDVHKLSDGKYSLSDILHSSFKRWYNKLSTIKQKELLDAVTKIEKDGKLHKRNKDESK